MSLVTIALIVSIVNGAAAAMLAIVQVRAVCRELASTRTDER